MGPVFRGPSCFFILSLPSQNQHYDSKTPNAVAINFMQWGFAFTR